MHDMDFDLFRGRRQPSKAPQFKKKKHDAADECAHALRSHLISSPLRKQLVATGPIIEISKECADQTWIEDLARFDFSKAAVSSTSSR